MSQPQSKPVVRPKGQRKPVEYDLGFQWRPLNTVLLAVGVVVILAGYLTLSKGSITLAPVLLVLGYVVFIPASLVFLGRSKASGE
jgi:hypothetical protein